MEHKDLYSTWVEVDLEAIENNVKYVSQSTGVQVMAVVKANAYGHGAVPVARAALRGGSTYLAVARIDEALELREAGLDCPIMLLGYTSPNRMEEAIANRITLTVWDNQQVEAVEISAIKARSKAYVHLKVDTGMSRLGAQPREVVSLARCLDGKADIIFEGLFTHFARSDEADKTTTDIQEGCFLDVLKALDEHGLRPPLVHAANSAASLTRSSAYFDMVRLGIAMYGLVPSSECPLPEGFRPALTWKTILSHVKILPPKRGVSYGHEYTTRTNEYIGTIPLGYADGFRRIQGNQVLINGKRVQVIGRICMDQIMVQLDNATEAKAGDEVVLIGNQKGEMITADEVAANWGTINYEVTCAIGARVPRFFKK